MKKNPGEKHLCFASLLLFIMFSLFALFLPFKFSHPRIWDKHYTLTVLDNNPSGNIISLLRDAGFYDVLSLETAEAEIFSYTEMSLARISVDELKNHYDKADPLYDPYLQGIEGYFTGLLDGRDASVYYIKSTIPVRSFYRSVQNAFRDHSFQWELAEYNSRKHIFNMIILILTVFGLTMICRTRGIIAFPLVSAVPWMVFVLRSPDIFVFFSLFSMLGISWTVSRALPIVKKYLNEKKNPDFKYDNSLRRMAAGYSVYLGTGFLFFLFSGISAHGVLVLTVLLPMAAQLVLPYLFFSLQVWKRSRQQHPIFYPVPIRRERIQFLFLSDIPVLFFLLLIFAGYPFLSGFTSRELVIPAPNRHEEVYDFSWHSLKILSAHEGRGDLPDFADYLAHRAYQETFFYGGKYHFPEWEQNITIHDYFYSEGSVIAVPAVEKIFTDEWYDGIMKSVALSGLTRLFLNQGGPVSVGYSRIDNLPLTQKNGRIHFWVYVGLFAPMVLLFEGIFPSRVIRKFELRRKQQTA